MQSQTSLLRRQNNSTNEFEVVPYKLAGSPSRRGYYFEQKLRQHFSGHKDWNLAILKAGPGVVAGFRSGRWLCRDVDRFLY